MVYADYNATDNRQSAIGNRQSPDSKFIQRALVVAPALSHLDEQVQENAPLEKLLDVGASGGADFFQPGAAFPDYYGLVRGPLDIDQAVNRCYALSFFPTFGHDCGDVRQLLAGLLKNFLSHKLGGEHAFGLISHLVFGIEHRARGKIVENLPNQQVGAISGERGDRND